MTPWEKAPHSEEGFVCLGLEIGAGPMEGTLLSTFKIEPTETTLKIPGAKLLVETSLSVGEIFNLASL